MLKDRDLISIQEIRELIFKADEALTRFGSFDQNRVDGIVRALSKAGEQNALNLAKMAVEETGIGAVKDKTVKNLFASIDIYNSVKEMKTIGLLKSDPESGIMEVAMPVGIICGIIPTTNPTSTVINKSIIALKAGNAIVFSPHPSARKCIYAAANLMHEAAVAAGAPRGIIGCPQEITMESTRELMSHPKTALILATGGSAMVHAAYSSGKPALGVGPGNVPAYVHSSADLKDAAGKIIQSKSFDNGTICSSEQAIIADRSIAPELEHLLESLGAFFMDESQSRKIAGILFTPQGTMTPHLVGRTAEKIALEAGIDVPSGTKVLIARPRGIGPDFPLSREKLAPVLAFYTVTDHHEGCDHCIRLLNLGGLGHSLVIHARDEDVIMEFALKKPVSRMLINAPSSTGAIGSTTALTPSMTLGCGSMGGNATSDNVTAHHLINIKRIARYKQIPPSQIPSEQNHTRQTIKMADLRRIVESMVNQNRS
ncbi:aldehyde dehydrogenase family protein [bacterium]|nr:aldehyde dehydrogenase family protein [candidate division CSSED10-310 bacterium]